MKIEYVDRLVAFIDVLGFKNLVYSETNDRIESYYDLVLSSFKEAVEKRGFEFLLISDSIVIYCENSKINLHEMIKMINIFQSVLIGNKILIRGAISHGHLFVNKSQNIIVGPGLINAYNLESKAVFPRVIIDRTLIKKHYKSLPKAIEENNANGLFHLSSTCLDSTKQDFPYLNYGYIIATGVSKKPYEGAYTLLSENYYKNEHTEKFEWLKCHLIVCLTERRTQLLDIPSKNDNEKKRLKNIEKYLPLLESL